MIALIGGCWAEYPGCVMDLEDECAHLRRPASHYASLGGALTLGLDEGGRVAGCVSMVPAAPGIVELKGLYVEAASRGTGLAQALCDHVVSRARDAGARELRLWSDTRFRRAHRFYERRGFVADGAIRAPGDLSNSLEYPYALPLGPHDCRPLGGAAAASAVRALARLSAAASGAEEAGEERAWTAIARATASGEALTVAGWNDGRLAGAAVLSPGAGARDRHRAALDRLVVDPASGGHGLGATLLAAAAREASRRGIDRLTAEAVDGGALAASLAACGWTSIGVVPGLAVGPEGTRCDVAMFWRAADREGISP